MEKDKRINFFASTLSYKVLNWIYHDAYIKNLFWRIFGTFDSVRASVSVSYPDCAKKKQKKKKTIRHLVIRGSFFVATIRSVEGKESSKESPERLTICRFISVPFRCNESRQQLLATRQTCSRIREDGFPFPGSLRRHGRAAHPAARKMRKPLMTWDLVGELSRL